MKDISTHASAQAVMDRSRSIAFVISLLGLAANCVIASVYGITSGFTPFLALNFLLQTAAIGSICVASHRDWHFRTVLNTSIAIIYVHLWSTTLYEAWTTTAFPLSFIVLLFVPFCLVVVSGYRVLLAYAAMQGALVYVYTSVFMAEAFGLNPDAIEFTQLASALSIMSALTLFVLAFLSYSRLKLDNRLLKLVDVTRRLAEEDDLTGLMNRRAFMDSLNAFCATDSPYVVAFLDLDRFKPLNDQFGHAAGDAVLRELSNRLQQLAGVRAAARLGGDELAVALDPSLSGAELDQTIANLHAGLTRKVEWDGKSLSVGVSIGYATNVRDAQSLPTLLKAADTAMRRAKAHHSGWASFSAELDGAALDMHSPEIEFRSALTRGDLRAAVQPIADAATLEIVGYEILSRWTQCGLRQTPEPNEFIPIAERLGLLNDLLWMTLDETLRSGELFPHRLAVNISPAQLQAPDFVDSFMNVLKAHAVDPACITLEITEQVAYRNIESNVQMLEKARRAGMTIALDDFGTGYSSLSMLDRLPLDKVKIDKSFSQRSGCSDRSDSILRASVSLAKQLKLTCCVEGIETEEAARKVRLFGADEIQGYWIGKPMLLSDTRVAFKRAS
jgi:diguanylate cyclase (GGDEF)-like protein